MSKKKSQVQTQMFVYMLALVVIALVLLYGYNAIRGFINTSNDVNLVQFKTDFSAAVEGQSHEFRSVIKKQLLLPSGYNEVIIVDLNKVANASLRLQYPMMYDSWLDGVEKNVFLIGKSKIESFYAGKIYFEPIQDHIILKAPDRIVEMKLTGMGGSTKIDEWE